MFSEIWGETPDLSQNGERGWEMWLRSLEARVEFLVGEIGSRRLSEGDSCLFSPSSFLRFTDCMFVCLPWNVCVV